MKNTELFKQATQHLIQLVEQIEDHQRNSPTPCSEWTVHDLVNHIANEYLWMPPLFAGETIAEVGNRFDGDILGENPKLALRQAAEKSVVVVGDPQMLSKTVQLSFGETPGSDYLDQILLDSVIHSWDLASALGVDRRISSKLLQAAWDYLGPRAEDWRNSGAFMQAFQLNDAQKEDLECRLLALTGRNPNWQP